ncbi:carbohydrate-binding module family 13 protein [Postia placenta MAD-698-R-SB12]|uniref:Carbohydrate-binding module family 13 protein n=1 Tax=Postia placenta MAD-698-R-SB12 TaxID=670580 RepID=A0A1X6NHY6_9APHY|nr:carbohydrate-binding module family 13 protein [Postia placenta MAD-698-R-SB12]OSX68056.1 carbohydrate-binding module family 13 protein [Postia placenta MAD-698-R-SB12]
MSIQAGNYRIQNVGIGNYVDLAGGSSIQGTRVQGWTNANNLNQLWQFEPVNDNTWKLLNAASGTYMLGPVHAINEGVVGGTPPDELCSSTPTGRIRFNSSTSLFCSRVKLQIVLQAADGGDNNQFWYLHPQAA